jgi:phospholipid transport system substrate-binding protein
MKLLRYLIFLCAALIGLRLPIAAAEEPAPDALMRQITSEVVTAIGQDKEIRAGDRAKIAALVEQKILPHFDLARATRTALGPSWRQASAQQQAALKREFQALLIRTYSGALASYSGETIELAPLRSKPGDTEVTVRSRIKRAGAEAIVIDYDMEKGPAGWKVFDVRVGGMSLVATYRTAFAEEVRNHGIEGLIALLAAKNRQATAQATSRKI